MKFWTWNNVLGIGLMIFNAINSVLSFMNGNLFWGVTCGLCALAVSYFLFKDAVKSVWA